MERNTDSIRASCSSPFNSSTGLSFKRRPTCQINEVDGQPDLLKDTATLRDRAARKEIERVRLRKLLNQGKKKRRRLNSDKLVVSPGNGASTGAVDDFSTREPHVPRKSRSVGYRRKGKSWRAIGFRLLSDQIELPTILEKPSPLSVQSEIEIEFEIAEVLSGLKKQVSSSDELLIDDDLEKPPVEHEDNQSISVRGCSVDILKAESISVNTNLGIQNHDKEKTKPEGCIADGGNLTTSQVSAARMDETESKQPVKFVIDLNEPPPVESSMEGIGMERLTADPKAVFKAEVKSVPEEATIRRFVQPWKKEMKGEIQDLDQGSTDGNKNELKQPFQTQQKGYSYTSIETDLLGLGRISSTNPRQGISLCGKLNSIQDGNQGFEFYSHITKQENNSRRASNLKIKDEHASHQIHKPLQAGCVMAGPLIFPLNQSQIVMADHSVSASSNENVRFSYPFLSVLPRNVCTDPLSDGKRMHSISSGGKNAEAVPFLDGQLHPSQMRLPIPIQQQKYLPFTTQAVSSVADIRTLIGQRIVTPQCLFPLRSANVALMPSAASGSAGQWKYAKKHDLRSEPTCNPSSSFSFASSTQSPSSDEAGQPLNSSVPQNHVVVPSFLDETNPGSQTLPCRGLLRRLCAGILTLVVLVLLVILLVWLILRPTKPRFVLQDATVYAFNVSQPNLLTVTFQVTISTRNPNHRIGVYYDRLSLYASYQNQQITLPTLVPPTYQGHKDVVIWSPFVYGNTVPVAPYLTAPLAQDQKSGIVRVNIKMDGRVRWKVGTWISGRYHLWVNCPAFIAFGNRNNGINVGSGIKFQLASSCEVDI